MWFRIALQSNGPSYVVLRHVSQLLILYVYVLRQTTSYECEPCHTVLYSVQLQNDIVNEAKSCVRLQLQYQDNNSRV